MVCDQLPRGQRPLSVTRRGGFFEDPFFKDAWGDYSHAVRKIVDRFNHGWMGDRPSSVGRDEATPHYHSVYRSLRAARMNYATHSTKFKEEGDVYKLVMDVREFVGGDVTVRTAGGTVSVRGKVDTTLQNPVVRHIDRSRRRKERDQKGRSQVEDDSDADSTASGASTSNKTLQRRFTLPADADGEKVHSTLSKDAILTVTIPKRNDVRVIPVTMENDRCPSPEKGRPSPERGRARLKRPSTSEPASPVPSKRSQDASGEPRRGSSSRGSEAGLNGTLNGGTSLSGTGANGFVNVEIVKEDSGRKKGDELRRSSKSTGVNGVLNELETSSDVTGARTSDTIEDGAERRGSDSRSRSRRSSKYEEAREVVIPIRMAGKNMSNGTEESSAKKSKENKMYDIKIHREGASDSNKETNKENESPKKRKSFTYINGHETDLNQANGYHVSDKRSNNHVSEEKYNSPDRKSREIKITNVDCESRDGKSSPKTFYYFGEAPKEGGEQNITHTKTLKEKSVSDEIGKKTGQRETLANGCVEDILESLRSKKQDKEEVEVDCSSSESGMSTNSGTLSAKTSISSTSSSAPSTSSDYSTPKKALTPPDSPTSEQENLINKSYKRKTITPPESPEIINGSVNSKVPPPLVYKLKSARNSEDLADDAEIPSVKDGQRAKRKNGVSTPTSPPFGKEVKVEHRQSLLEDDMFKDCWKDYSNTLQDVLSRLQELSTELGQTPKFLVSSPTVPEVPLPGSTDTTPASRPSYQFATTPEAGGGSSSADLRGSPWARHDATTTVMAGRDTSVGVDADAPPFSSSSTNTTISSSSPATTSDTSVAAAMVTSGPSQYSSRLDVTAPHHATFGSTNLQQESQNLSGADHQKITTPWRFRNSNDANGDQSSLTANASDVTCASRPPHLSLSSFPDGEGGTTVGKGRHRPTSLHLQTNQEGPLLRKLRINSPVEALQERYFNQMAPSGKVSSSHLSGDVHYVPVEVDGATRNSSGEGVRSSGGGGVTATVGGPSSSSSVSVAAGKKAPAVPGATSRQSQVTGGGGNNTSDTAAANCSTRRDTANVGQREHSGTAAFPPPTYHLGGPIPSTSSHTRPTSSSLAGTSASGSDSHPRSISVKIDRVVGSGGSLVSGDANLGDASAKGNLGREISGSEFAGVVSAGESVASVSARGLEELQEGAWSDSRSPTGAGGGAPDARVRPHLPSAARSAGLEEDSEGAQSGLCRLNNEDTYSKGDSNRDPKAMDYSLLASKHSDYAAPSSTRSLGSPILNRLADHRPHSWAQETAPASDHPKTGIALDAERIIEQTRKLSSTTLNNLDSPAQDFSKSDIYNKKRFNFETSDMSRVSPESNTTSIEDDSLEEEKSSTNEDSSKDEGGIVQGRLSFPIERLRRAETSPSKRGVSKAEQEQAASDVTSWSRPLAAHQTRIQSDDVTPASVERPRQSLQQSPLPLRQTVNESSTCKLHHSAQPDMGGVFSKGRTRGASQPPTLSTTSSSPVASQAQLRSPRLRDRPLDERPTPPYVSQKSEPPRRYSGFSHVTSDNVRRMRDVWGSRQEKPPAPPPPSSMPPGTPPHTRKQPSVSRTAPTTPRYGQAPPGSPFTPRRTASPSTPQRSPSPAPPRRKPSAVPSAVSERMERRAASPSARERRAPSPSPRERKAPSPSSRERGTASPISRDRGTASPISRDRGAASPISRERRAPSPSPRDRRAASPSPRTRGSSSPAGKYSSSASASPARVRSPQSPSYNSSSNSNSTHDTSEYSSRYRNPRSSSASRASSSPEKSHKSPSPTKSDPRLPRKTGTPPTTPTRKTFPSQPYGGSPADRINGSTFNYSKTPSSPRSSPRTSPPHTNGSSSSFHKCRSSPSRDTTRASSTSKSSPSRSKPRAPSTPSTTTSYHPSTTAGTTSSKGKTSTSSSPSSRARTTGSSSSDHRTAPSAHKRIYKRFRDASLQPNSETLCFVEQEDRYKMVLDVAEFVSGEVDVLQDDKVLTVKGSVETQEGEGQSAIRTFHRTFNIPQNSKEEDIDSALSEDGFLTIFVPKKRERVIKIELVD